MPRYDIFVSYSRMHEPLVAPVCDLLRIAGTVFRDSDDIRPGDRWEQEIETALKHAKVVLLLWCCHAAKRPWVLKELALAKELNKKVIPVLLCNAPLGDYARAFQWIDMRGALIHECQCEVLPPIGSEEAPNTISLADLSLSLGFATFDSTQIDVAWSQLVDQNRLGLILNPDEAKVLAAVAMAVSLAIVATLDTPVPITLLLGSGVAILAELMLALYRWMNFASVRKLGLSSDRVAKVLALTVSRAGAGVSTAAKVVDQKAHAKAGNGGEEFGCGGCGCIVIIITVLAVLLALSGIL